MLATFLLASIINCTNIDDTLAIQQSVTNDQVTILSGECAISGVTGIRIPSDRVISAYNATTRLISNPICGSGKCKLFEVIPGSIGFTLKGGTFIGDPNPAVGWQIGLRIDSGHNVLIQDSVFKDFRTDAIWIGGNLPSTDILLSGVEIEKFGRNAISITNAVGVTLERGYLTEAWAGADPGAGLDVEPNPGESVHDLTIIDTETRNNVVGFYLQQGKGDKQGTNYKVINCRVINNRKYGLILNSVVRALVVDNLIVSPLIGLSIGSHLDTNRASNVTVINNQITASRAIILAGIRDSRLWGNSLGSGRIEAVVLGFSGDMVFSGN